MSFLGLKYFPLFLHLTIYFIKIDQNYVKVTLFLNFNFNYFEETHKYVFFSIFPFVIRRANFIVHV